MKREFCEDCGLDCVPSTMFGQPVRLCRKCYRYQLSKLSDVCQRIMDSTPEEDRPLKRRLLEAEDLALSEDDFSRHCSDLYVVNRPGVVNWLRLNYEFFTSVTSFVSPAGSDWNGAGRLCLDIPFAAWDEYEEARHR